MKIDWNKLRDGEKLAIGLSLFAIAIAIFTS